MSLVCPVCGEGLKKEERQYRCPKGHCFDRARQGYVNLLQSQRSSDRNHGDDREMVTARREFLEKGYYAPLRELLTEKVYFYTAKNGVIADAGCGEGWYTEGVAERLPEATVIGFDISKEALKWAAKRQGMDHLAVASCYRMPLADASVDALLNFFSPLAAEEYARVLKPGGHLFRAVPGTHHLWELKSAVYDTPKPNLPEPEALAGLTLLERCPIRSEITLPSNEQLQALFKMTPYYYRTSPKDKAKLEQYTTFTTGVEFTLLIYKRED
ncbi:MAG: methyltransferase domain-containing protein [Clostridia bacterium]|nr:methyltransferase domain-containing protein [Clostridia bacterium]